MFERFSKQAKKVVFYARFEASKHGSSAIDPGHLLLGLEREDKRSTRRFLGEHPELERLREHGNPAGAPWPQLSTSAELPLNEASREAIKSAAAAADSERRVEIDTADLLQGLLHVATG